MDYNMSMCALGQKLQFRKGTMSGMYLLFIRYVG